MINKIPNTPKLIFTSPSIRISSFDFFNISKFINPANKQSNVKQALIARNKSLVLELNPMPKFRSYEFINKNNCLSVSFAGTAGAKKLNE